MILSHFERESMNKENRVRMSFTKMFHDRNLKVNQHMIENFWNALKDESNDTLKKLFTRLYERNYYSDYQKTVPRMPILPEIKDLLRLVKSESYISPAKHTLAMPEHEKQKKRAMHIDMSKKIKQFLQNGAKDEELDVIFAQK